MDLTDTMPRKPRLQFPGAFYHVFHRGNRRERIFIDARDYARFKTMLFEAAAASNVLLYRWCQLPNHFHLLVQTPNGNLAEFMSRLLTRYAMHFNWRHKLVGHVFQGRYGSRVCDKEAYFLQLIRYIELNPYKSKFRNGTPLGTWRWSSHGYFMQPPETWPSLLRATFQEQMALFSPDPRQARERYARFLMEGLSEGCWEDFYTAGNAHCLGDETFTQEMALRRQDPEAMDQTFRTMDPARLLQEVVRLSGCTQEELAGPSLERRLTRWRQAFIHVGRTAYRFPMKMMTDQIVRSISSGSHMLRSQRTVSEGQEEINLLKEAVTRITAVF